MFFKVLTLRSERPVCSSNQWDNVEGPCKPSSWLEKENKHEINDEGGQDGMRSFIRDGIAAYTHTTRKSNHQKSQAAFVYLTQIRHG